MTALATVITPPSWGAVELANGRWLKKILPIGQISYQGRTLRFDRDYLTGLVDSFRSRAYDAVPLQFADDGNRHTNDPERTRGQITDLQLRDDGLYAVAELTPRGEATLREHPNLGVSARIVEQYDRADGRHYDAAIQHVLATWDPRITQLGPWQPADLANTSAMVIDLSSSVWLGEPGPPPAPEYDTSLSDQELADWVDAIDETEAEMLNSGYSYDPEAAGYLADFDASFQHTLAADAARAQARQYAEIQDLTSPARTDEVRMARALQRYQDGVYSAPGAVTFAAASREAIELANQRAAISGRAACGEIDDFGRCTARYHDLSCDHSVSSDSSVELANAGVHGRTLRNFMLSNFSHGPARVWGDPDSDDGDPYATVLPARTVELAARLSESWGLHGDTALPGAPAWDELMVGDPPLGGLGGYPGIGELAQGLGLK